MKLTKTSRRHTRWFWLLAAYLLYAAPNDPYDALAGSILGSPVSVSWGANRIDTFVVGTDHQLYQKVWDGNKWLPSATGYAPLGGSVRVGSIPAVTSWGSNRLDIVVVGSDRKLYHKAWDGSHWQPSQSGWDPLGGAVRDGSSASVTSWGPNRLDIVVVSDDRQLYHKAWDGGRWLPSPTGFEPLGGQVRDGSSPSIKAWGTDRLDIVIVADDGQVHHKAWTGNGWQPSPTTFESLGGSVSAGSSPSMVSRGANRLDIFTIGSEGLDHKAFEGHWLPSPTEFEHLGGVVSAGTSPSAVSWGGNRVSVFVVGTDQVLYHKEWDGSRWWEYENLGVSLAGNRSFSVAKGSSPGAVSWGPGRMDLFAVGADGAMYHKARNSFQWLTDVRFTPAHVSGSTKWAVILCKTSDHPEQPQDLPFFRNLFTEDGNGLGGMYDYWRDMSYGAISLKGSQVKGWFSIPQTLDQLNALSRQDKIRACVSAASGSFHDSSTNFYAIAVMFNTPSVDSGAAGSATLTFNGVTKAYPVLDLASSVWVASFAAHEMGHAYGLDHSWSRRPDIEYGDPYDIMSAMNVKSFVKGLSLFGATGPVLTAVYRDALGWIPAARIFSSQGATATITLAPLEQPDAEGFLMAKIFAFGRADHYYTVESHRQTGWNTGYAQDLVLVHEVLPDGRSYLVKEGGPERRIAQPFQDQENHLSVAVLGMEGNKTTLQIARKN